MKDDTTLVSEVIEKIPNKYLAVVVTSKRARAINAGSLPAIKTKATKTTTVALEEVASGIYTSEMASLGITEPERKEKLLPSPKTPEITNVKEIEEGE